jgi:hypothetical protein
MYWVEKYSKSDDLQGNYDYHENIQLVNTQPGLYFFNNIDGSKRK